MNPSPFRSLVCVAAVAVATAAGAAEPETELLAINARLRSARLVAYDAAKQRVDYLPTRALCVTEDDRPAMLCVLPLDDAQSVSGYLTLQAEPADLKDAETLTRQAFGDKVQLHRVPVDTYECWLKDGTRTLWHQPEGDGPIRRMVIDIRTPKEVKRVTLVVAVTRIEQQKVEGVKLRLDWEAIQTTLRKRLQADTPFGDAAFDVFVGELLETKAVRVESNRSVAGQAKRQIRDLIATEIRNRVLQRDGPQEENKQPDKKEPAKDSQEPGFILKFRLKRESDRRRGVETLDLNEQRNVARTFLVVSTLNLE